MSEWISVKDKLPELCEEVLVYCTWPDNRLDNEQEVTHFITCGCYQKETWDLDFQALNAFPTHWQPLPEPPEKEASK